MSSENGSHAGVPLVPVESDLNPNIRKYRAHLLHICERLDLSTDNFTRDLQDPRLGADQLLHKLILSLAADLALHHRESLGADSVIFSPFVRADPEENFLQGSEGLEVDRLLEEARLEGRPSGDILVSSELPPVSQQFMQGMQSGNGMQPGYMASSGMQYTSAFQQGGPSASYAQQQYEYGQQYYPAVQQQQQQSLSMLLGQGALPLASLPPVSFGQSQAPYQTIASGFASAPFQHMPAQYMQPPYPHMTAALSQPTMSGPQWQQPINAYASASMMPPAHVAPQNVQTLPAEQSFTSRGRTPLEQMADISKAAESLQRADAYVSWKPGFLNILSHYPGLSDRDKCSVLKRLVSQTLQTHVSSDQAWIDGNAFPALFACLDRAFAPRTSQCLLELQNMRHEHGETCLQFLDRLHKLHLKHNVRFPQGKDEIQALVMRFNDQHRSNLRMELLIKSGDRPGFAELRASCQEMDALNAASMSAAQTASRATRPRGAQVNAADSPHLGREPEFKLHHGEGEFRANRGQQQRGRGRFRGPAGRFNARGRHGTADQCSIGCPDLDLNADHRPLCSANAREHLIASAHRTRRNRPNRPEPAQPNTDAPDALPFPDNIRAQLRRQNFSFSNVGPMTRLLDNTVHMTLRQLVAATNLGGWRDACKTIADLEQEETGADKFQEATEDAVRLVSIVGSALADPIARAEGGSEPDLAPAFPASPAVSASVEPAKRAQTFVNAVKAEPQIYSQYCVTMPTMQASLQASGRPTSQLSLDSGAAFSCISETAYRRDRQYLLRYSSSTSPSGSACMTIQSLIAMSSSRVHACTLVTASTALTLWWFLTALVTTCWVPTSARCMMRAFSTCMCRIGCPPDGGRRPHKPYQQYQFCPITYTGKNMDVLYVPASQAAPSLKH